MSPVKIGETLRHIDECIAEAMRQHTDDDMRAAARQLGLGDWLPEPQQELELRG